MGEVEKITWKISALSTPSISRTSKKSIQSEIVKTQKLSKIEKKLKRLYRNLEDLWNYRLPLTPQIKSRIAPPNGLVFTTRVNDIWNMSVKEDIQSIILNEVSKFNNANLESDKKLGYMYFLIGLGMVSKECYDSHQWLMLANG